MVSFSINKIYATAELIRRRRGAVIMGALRKNKKYRDLYQNGDVDFWSYDAIR